MKYLVFSDNHGDTESIDRLMSYYPNNDGVFSQMRIYDKWHRLRIEIAYHPERNLDPSGKNVLHYHIYEQPAFRHGKAHRMSEKNYNRYKKFLKGVKF